MPSLYVVHGSAAADLHQDHSAAAARLTTDFCTECNFRPLPYMVREFVRWLDDGFQPEMITEAIRRTARAYRPSFSYLSAIMRNAAAANQYTLASFTTQKIFRPQVSAQMYGQRQYTEEELLSVSDDLIAAARKERNS